MNSRNHREHSLTEDMKAWFAATFDRFKGRSDQYIDEHWPPVQRQTWLEMDENTGRYLGVDRDE